MKYGPYGWIKDFLLPPSYSVTKEHVFAAFNKAFNNPHFPEALDPLQNLYENHQLAQLEGLRDLCVIEEMYYRWCRIQEAIYRCDVCKVAPDYHFCELCQALPDREACAQCDPNAPSRSLLFKLYLDVGKGYRIQGLLCERCRNVIKQGEPLLQSTLAYMKDREWPLILREYEEKENEVFIVAKGKTHKPVPKE